MKKFDAKFYLIKLLVLLIVNLFTFGIAFLLTQILKSMENENLAVLIASGVSNLAFLAYIFKTTRTMKNPNSLSATAFALRETIVYAFFVMVIWLVFLAFSTNRYVCMFFLPNTFFVYLTNSLPIGFLLETVTYAAVAFAARSVKVNPSRKS